MTEQQIVSLLEERGAIIRNSHVVYTSGLHGSAYINKDAVYLETQTVSLLCKQIADHFAGSAVEIVAAPAVGGVALSQWTAYHLTVLGKPALAIYAEKEQGGAFRFRRGYDQVVRGKRTLVVEDVLTTGGSLKAVIEAVRQGGGTVVGAAAICNRGGVSASQVGTPILYCLANLDLQSWSANACPLCQAHVPINLDVGKGREFVERTRSA